ncbi:MAG: hypothetical protein KDD62_12545 [Bdellovibrionales bacterium]|nr:hypothetical protein [Bdellovibrionales bacterium]
MLLVEELESTDSGDLTLSEDHLIDSGDMTLSSDIGGAGDLVLEVDELYPGELILEKDEGNLPGSPMPPTSDYESRPPAV